MRTIKLSYFVMMLTISIFYISIYTVLVYHQADGQSSTNYLSKGEFSTYENQFLKIKMQYPNDMQRIDLGNTILFKPLNNSNPQNRNFTISIENLPSKNMALNDYTDSQIAKLNLSDNRLLEATDSSIDNNPAMKVLTVGKADLKKLQIWTLKDDKAYTLTYIANSNTYSNYLPIIEKVIKSLQIDFLNNEDKVGLPIGFSPVSLAFNHGFLYVANSNSNTISVINTGDVFTGWQFQEVGNITVDSDPTSIAFNRGFLYVANSNSNTISVMSISVGGICGGVSIGGGVCSNDLGNFTVGNDTRSHPISIAR